MNDNMVSIRNLSHGDLFLYNGNTFIKTDDSTINAVDLATGEISFFPSYIEVERVSTYSITR